MNHDHALDVVNHMYRLCLTATDTTPARVGRDALRTLWRNHLNCHGDLLRLQESVEGLAKVLWNAWDFFSFESFEGVLQDTTWDALQLHNETVNLVAWDILRAQYDVAYEMAALCFCGDGKSAAWGLARETLDAAHEAGCKVADLPLPGEVKAVLADMTEVPTAQTVECYAAEVLYKAAQYGTGGAAQVKALAAALKPAIACGCLVAALEGEVMPSDPATAD